MLNVRIVCVGSVVGSSSLFVGLIVMSGWLDVGICVICAIGSAKWSFVVLCSVLGCYGLFVFVVSIFVMLYVVVICMYVFRFFRWCGFLSRISGCGFVRIVVRLVVGCCVSVMMLSLVEGEMRVFVWNSPVRSGVSVAVSVLSVLMFGVVILMILVLNCSVCLTV